MNSDGSLSLSGSDASLVPEFVTQAHENVSVRSRCANDRSPLAQNVSAQIAIGGWGGSIYFSSNVATAENRTAFVKTVTNFTQYYNFDGVDFEYVFDFPQLTSTECEFASWEYPNKQGIGCNVIDANDTQNFLDFLQELRQDPVGAKLTLSAGTAITPFVDASGNPSVDVSGFAKVLDYIAIMNYDIWGAWSSGVGPNSPLNDTCAAPANQQGSAVSAVKAWSTAGMPVNQIVLGVPSYGRSFSVSPSNAFVSGSSTDLAAYPKFNASNQPLGDAWDNTGSTNPCGVYEGPGGTFRLWGLVDGGFLDTQGNPASGIYYRYDNCSQTVQWFSLLGYYRGFDLTILFQPYVYNSTSQVMVSFDNAQSFAAKGNYIKETGLRGFAMWEAGGDYNNLLLTSITQSVAGSS